MTTVYLDTSALVRLVHPEPGSTLAAALWDRASLVATSRSSDVELRSVLAAAERRGLLSEDALAAALDRWGRLWAGMYVVELVPAVAERAAELVAAHPLRGGDAVQVASALTLAPHVVMAVWDEHVAAAAHAEGLEVLPGPYGLGAEGPRTARGGRPRVGAVDAAVS